MSVSLRLGERRQGQGGATAAARLEVLTRLAGHAASQPGAAAVVEIGAGGEGRVVSYGEMYGGAASVAAGVRRAVPPGGTVLLSCPNRAEFVAAFLGALGAGCVVMPVHPRLTGAEVRRIAGVVGAAAMIGTDEAIGHVAGSGVAAMRVEGVLAGGAAAGEGFGETRGGDTPGLLLQSSGTTGMPNIAVRSGASLDAVAANVAGATRLVTQDRVLVCIPLCHSYGVENGLLGPIFAGASIRLCEGFDAPVVYREVIGGATVFPGVPFMFEALATMAGSGSARGVGGSLRLAYSAGTMLPRAVAGRFRERVGAHVGQLYGATEVGSVTFNDPGSAGLDVGSAGVCMGGVRILILDPERPDAERPLGVGVEGHVAVRAPSMLTRYLEGETPFAGGYFLTGDLGRMDERGRLTITGRLKLQIDVGGLKVNPAEVEAVLLEHPGVAECVVVGQALGETVTRVRAVVVPVEGMEVDVAELRRFAQGRLAPYKVPRIFEFRGSLPKSAMGKVLRREVENS